MSAGLAASTVTPGSTAPVVSLTVPAMLPLASDCAHPAAGSRRSIPIRALNLIRTGSPPYRRVRWLSSLRERRVAGPGRSVSGRLARTAAINLAEALDGDHYL